MSSNRSTKNERGSKKGAPGPGGLRRAVIGQALMCGHALCVTHTETGDARHKSYFWDTLFLAKACFNNGKATALPWIDSFSTMDVKHIHLPTARMIHDGQPEMPFWGWPTSTIDWCEESNFLLFLPAPVLESFELTVLSIDYKITPYIAEFANTVTNAFFSKNYRPFPNLKIVLILCSSFPGLVWASKFDSTKISSVVHCNRDGLLARRRWILAIPCHAPLPGSSHVSVSLVLNKIKFQLLDELPSTHHSAP